MIEQGDTDAAGLHDQARLAHCRRARGEGGVQADVRHGDAEAVRADEPHAVPTADSEQIGAGPRIDPGGDHDQCPDTSPPALLSHIPNGCRGHRHYRQVHGLR